MLGIYDDWRTYEGERVILRPVKLEDVKDLLKVYSDEKSRTLFNCDNFEKPCYFDTLKDMEDEIKFYLMSYEKKYFVRWTVVLKDSNTIIGTIENFHRSGARDDFNDKAILRIDLGSDYEREDIIEDILKLVVNTAGEDFNCSFIATKAPKEAAERIRALRKMGFVKSSSYLLGDHGEKYGDYYERNLRTLHLGSVYLVVKDFEKSIDFYENLLQMKVSLRNMDRFAQFIFEGHNISIMSGYFDERNPDKITHGGGYDEEYDNLGAIANAENTHKFVLNFYVRDLKREQERVRKFSDELTALKMVSAGHGEYWYFNLKDPDGNVIEITGNI